MADLEGYFPLGATILSVGGEILGSRSPFPVILGSINDFSGGTGVANLGATWQ